MLFRLSFFPRWLYSDGHRWFTQATKPKESVSFDGIISNGICQVWPTLALPDGSCLQRLRLGRLWLITFGQNLRRRLRWASWWREELWRFCVGVAFSHYYEICTVYVTLVLGRWKGILGSHLRIFSNDLKAAIQKTPSITNEKFKRHYLPWACSPLIKRMTALTPGGCLVACNCSRQSRDAGCFARKRLISCRFVWQMKTRPSELLQSDDCFLPSSLTGAAVEKLSADCETFVES